MARNIAKRFATMKLLYWKPIITGSGVKHEAPVEFKGFYIGNAAFGDGGVSDMVAFAFRQTRQPRPVLSLRTGGRWLC